MNTIDPVKLSDFQRQIFQLERDNTSELIHFERGTTPILLSAPHTVNFLKEDGNFKMREGYTKAIVKYLALKTGAFLMIKENSDGIDSNKPEMENYKHQLLEVIKNYQIQLCPLCKFYANQENRLQREDLCPQKPPFLNCRLF